MARPPKLGAPAQLVVWGCRTRSRSVRGSLTMAEKAVWYHTWFMDQGGADGCYMSVRSMGARLGLSERTIEDARSRLGRLALTESWARDEGRERAYRATLPAGIPQPRTFKEATPALSAALDAHIAAFDAGPTAATYTGPRQGRTDDHGKDVLPAGGAPREGGRGEGVSSASQPARQLFPAVEDRTKAEEVGGRSGLMRPGTTGTTERVGDVLGRIDHRLPAA